MKRKITCILIMLLLVFPSTVAAITHQSESEPNDYADKATPISIGSEKLTKGSIKDDKNKDLDWYSFSLKKGSIVELYGFTYGTYNELQYFIYSSDISKDYISSGEIPYNSHLGYGYLDKYHYLSPGKYYIKFSSRKFQSIPNCDYEFKFSIKEYENFSESNNSISKATKVENKKMYKGILHDMANKNYDKDYFKLKASKKGQYNFYFKKYNNLNGAATGEIRVTAYNKKGKEIKVFNNGKTSRCAVASGYKINNTIKVPKGTVYFRVFQESMAQYELKITKLH